MRGLDPKAATDYILSLKPFGVKLGLGNITHLLNRMGDPHHDFPSIHVAGTNGKGSVCAMLESTLRAAGLRTGMNTSPHLVDLRERIQVGGELIPEDTLATYVEEIIPLVEEMSYSQMGPPTYFEVTTALAFKHFAREQVDMAIVEVGLGGRLDATNVLLPKLSIITSISKDHTQHLGDTLAEIAGEKAGIIKPGVPLIYWSQESEVKAVIEARANELGCWCENAAEKVRISNQSMDKGGQSFDMQAEGMHWSGIRVGLLGPHQIKNAALALRACHRLDQEDLGFRITQVHARKGLESARWPGRLEILGDDPLLVLDSAHNVAGAQALAEAIRVLPYNKLHLVFGAMGNKDYPRMLAALAPVTDSLTTIRSPEKKERAADPKELASAASGLIKDILASEDPLDGFKAALEKAKPEDMVLVAGSMFHLGPIREWYLANELRK